MWQSKDNIGDNVTKNLQELVEFFKRRAGLR